MKRLKEMYSGLKVLLCDDSLMIIKKMGGVLKSLGVGVVQTALDGEQAVKLFKLTKPDVVFMDQVMPNKTGLEALKEIIAYHPDALVFMLSSMGTIAKREEAERLGARGFLQKPISADDIKTILELVTAELEAKKE
jgi:two-component system chemotaxis response regulator CheY